MVDFAASDPVAGKATLNRTVQCIRRIIQPELVILFGSRGRREAGEENDYDLMVGLPARATLLHTAPPDNCES
jgi:predicted nucleotidyltransferase